MAKYSDAEIGRIVTRQIIQKFGFYWVNGPRLEDAYQDGALGAVKAHQRKDNEAYRFKAARNQVLKGLFGKSIEYTVSLETLDTDDLEVSPLEENEIPSSFLSEDALIQFFLDKRNKKGARGLAAAKRDAYICLRLMEGAGNAAIAQELDMPEHDIRHYRAEICKRLRSVL